MIRGGENLLYGFLAGAITAKLLKSFCNIEIPPSLLFAVAVALFTAVFCFCLKIPIVTSKVQRRAFFGAVILFFFICGLLNDSRSHFMSETGGEGKTGRMVSAIREKAIERTSYRGRWIKLILAFLLIIFYSMMTGFSASIQRAAVMIFIYKAVEMSGRFRGRWSALAFAASVIIIINPKMLATVSFQLSFAAVVGIIAIYPPMYKSFERLFTRHRTYRIISPVVNMLCMSTACQITTTPFTWFYFRSSPELFLIANLVAVPLVTVAIYIYPFAFIFTYFNRIDNYPAAILEFVLKILNEAILYIGK